MHDVAVDDGVLTASRVYSALSAALWSGSPETPNHPWKMADPRALTGAMIQFRALPCWVAILSWSGSGRARRRSPG